MNLYAIYTDTFCMYWSPIFMALGVFVCVGFTAMVYLPRGGHFSELGFTAFLGTMLSLLISRSMYWYCHQEQFSSLASSILNLSGGGFLMPGILIGTAIAVILLEAADLVRDGGLLFDCMAPGAALGLGIIRLSSLFSETCRGKMLIENESLRRLPIAYLNKTASGGVEYRFATFFVEAMILFVIFVVLLVLIVRNSKNWSPGKGKISLLFLAMYSIETILLDSTRYDSSFLPINGFVSLPQILCALSVIGVMITLNVQASRRRRPRTKRILLAWLTFVIAFAVIGGMEYWVQRHGEMYVLCYSIMAIGCVLMLAAVLTMKSAGNRKKQTV